MQGSSVTGRSHETGIRFDSGRISDFDVAVHHPDLFNKAQELGLVKPGHNKTMPLKADNMRKLGFGDLVDSLSKQYGREVNFKIFNDIDSLREKGTSYTIAN